MCEKSAVKRVNRSLRSRIPEMTIFNDNLFTLFSEQHRFNFVEAFNIVKHFRAFVCKLNFVFHVGERMAIIRDSNYSKMNGLLCPPKRICAIALLCLIFNQKWQELTLITTKRKLFAVRFAGTRCPGCRLPQEWMMPDAVHYA